MVTPEEEKPNDSDTKPANAVGPCARNTASGVVGGVVQAGAVHGDVHLHAVPPPPMPVVPRQLPAAPGLFAGRAAELVGLDRVLIPVTPDGSDTAGRGRARADLPADLPAEGATAVISAIGGAGGIGKTWLALAWARRHMDRFPDGQLFVDLHGFSPAGEPTASAVAVRGFLDALGVDPGRIPTDLDAQAALYRSLISGRRMLVVLDNAATSEQVIPLLPGSATCTVLITGRHRLASLIDRHGARHVTLGVLTRDEARALLTARLGSDLVAAEPDAIDELVDLCGGHPLALSITARNAATRPDIPLAGVATELRELGLEMLDHDTDPAASLPTVLSWSLHRLTGEQRALFGLMGIAPGPDTTLPAVAALIGTAPSRVRRALSVLDEASLLERRPHGRFAMHDLVRDYAATTAHDLPDGVREMALVRVVDFYLHTALAADRLLNPPRPLLRLDPPAPGVHSHPLPDAAAATAWLETEHATLLATQRAAVALDCHPVTWHLAWALETFHHRRGHWRDAITVWRAALDAASHLPDPATSIRAHRFLGHACAQLGLHEEATRNLDQALHLAVHHDNPTEQAHTHQVLAVAWARQDEYRRASVHARHALDLYRTLDQPVREAAALNQVGWYAARLGNFDTAHDHCLAALILHRHHHHPNGAAQTLGNLGYIAHKTGRYHQALEYYRESVDLLRRSGDTFHEALAHDWTGQTHAALGQHDQAYEAWREALYLYQQQGRDTDAQRVQRQLDNLTDLAQGRT
ncbi:tetratricopeptide (TPR) repeat protein [Saccharothrix saharensis]|uniref:Tetratricopeptide (TPR) repeat protein n=1 Tax=Saccharothrix saharensis TaxID=571190 RepID=A0A543JQV4_9PSEU|nr:tetratricopeptide repeat protein [Saccharothrix saharensis]TQM85226.1 tetratricopeptide (TPR) repeat protein [Saccharothrix saharensis]